MKKRIVGFVVFLTLLLGFAHVALAAEGSALYIHTDYAIEGQTYGNGYVPTVSNNTAISSCPLPPARRAYRLCGSPRYSTPERTAPLPMGITNST